MKGLSQCDVTPAINTTTSIKQPRKKLDVYQFLGRQIFKTKQTQNLLIVPFHYGYMHRLREREREREREEGGERGGRERQRGREREREGWGGEKGRERRREGYIHTPVSERGDDQSWSITKVLVRIFELSVTDISKAVFLCLVPAMSQLAQPGEGLSILNLLSYQFSYHITSMHINGTYCHDLLSVSLTEITKQQCDQSVQLSHL